MYEYAYFEANKKDLDKIDKIKSALIKGRAVFEDPITKRIGVLYSFGERFGCTLMGHSERIEKAEHFRDFKDFSEYVDRLNGGVIISKTQSRFQAIHQALSYSSYHNSKIKVLFNKDGTMFKRVKRLSEEYKMEVYMFLLKEDDVPEDLDYKLMTFHQFVKLLQSNHYEYLGYYYDVKPDYFWHIDAYSAFTKRSLNAFLHDKTIDEREKWQYRFLFETNA